MLPWTIVSSADPFGRRRSLGRDRRQRRATARRSTSRLALLSFREFKNARPVIVDRAGYREVVKQAIGRHL
jgi:hypothetical protein